MGDTKETLAYQELEDTVRRNKSQQIQHYGATLKDLQDKSTGEIPSTCSPFVKDPRPVTYYYPHEKAIDGTVSKKRVLDEYKLNSGEISVEYELNDSSHGLCGISLGLMLPQVRAMPGYVVKWCTNVASHAFRYGSMTHTKTRINYFDDVTYDDYLSQIQGRADFQSVWEDLGNLPELQEFSTFLPQRETIYRPPLFFNDDDTTNMFPLYLCTHRDDIRLNLAMVTDPQSLLIIAKEIDGSIELVTPLPGVRYAEFMIDGKPITNFSTPQGCGNYVFVSKEEREENWCEGNDNCTSFFVDQAIPFSSANEARDSKVTIERLKTDYPVTRISWVSELVGNKTRHVYSNYTSNPSPFFMTSLSPISYSSINNGTVDLLKNCPGSITTLHNSRFYGRCKAAIPGINFRSLGIRNDTNTIKPGYYFRNGTIEVSLEERDYEVRNGNREGIKEKFTVTCILHTRTEFQFSSYPKSEEERIKQEKSIISQVNKGS